MHLDILESEVNGICMQSHHCTSGFDIDSGDCGGFQTDLLQHTTSHHILPLLQWLEPNHIKYQILDMCHRYIQLGYITYMSSKFDPNSSACYRNIFIFFVAVSNPWPIFKVFLNVKFSSDNKRH